MFLEVERAKKRETEEIIETLKKNFAGEPSGGNRTVVMETRASS